MQLLRDASKSGAPGDANKAAPTDACARALLDGLPPVMWFIRSHMRQHRTAGLSVPQFRALMLIDKYPTASLSLVSEHLGVSQPSASRLISGLVARGLVARRECAEDRRQCALDLTAKGRSSLCAARQATLKCIADEIAGLSGNDRQTVADAMRVLRNVFAHPGTAAVHEESD